MEENDETKQKNRSRKKQLYASIRSQMEFYFSPSNLARDTMTNRLLNENGSIELTQFLSYNKIRALTNNVKDLSKALKHSTELEVTEDMKVKPIVLRTKDNIDECTIYIEQIPQDAEHDWLKEQFAVYGTVDYVSIPKFNSSKKCKGFAFVEFSSPEYAEKAIEEYKKAGCYLPTSEMDPKELLSIVHHTEEAPAKEDKKKNKRKLESDSVDEPSNKKIKNESEEGTEIAESTENSEPAEQSMDENKLKGAEITEISKQADDTKMQEINDENIEDIKKKKNRNKKKKTKKTKITPETSGFKILSKKDWKHLRNKYLNIQWQKMKLLKQHLNQVNKKQKINKNVEKVDEEPKNVLSELVHGTVVKISVDNPIINTKQFKGEVTAINSDVKYIDLREGCTLVHARFKTDKAAKKFSEDSPWPRNEILTGEEELEYWKRIHKDREEKLSKPKVKQRGKEKLFKKAEKALGRHIIFDDAQ